MPLGEVESRELAIEVGEHVVQFYEHEAALVQVVGSYLVEAHAEGAIALVIATPDHRRAFEDELRRRGSDPAAAKAAGRLMTLDAPSVLRHLVPATGVDRDSFNQVVGGVVREAASSGRPVRIYGELVDLLWRSGDVVHAIELEQLWHELGEVLPFSLLCAYQVGPLATADHAHVHEICQVHSAVVESPAEERSPTAPADLQLPVRPRRFLGRPGSVRAARRFVTMALRQFGHDGPVLDDARLIVSELTTNAIRHARSGFSVTVDAAEPGVRISVADSNPAAPVLRTPPQPDQISGRGMFITAELASDWGVAAEQRGKTVWVTLRP